MTKPSKHTIGTLKRHVDDRKVNDVFRHSITGGHNRPRPDRTPDIRSGGTTVSGRSLRYRTPNRSQQFTQGVSDGTVRNQAHVLAETQKVIDL